MGFRPATSSGGEPADGSITSTKITDGTIAIADMSASAKLAGTLIANLKTTTSVLTNMPLAEQEYDNTNETRTPIYNPASFSFIRVMARITITGPVGSKLFVKYSLDNGTTWAAITGAEISLAVAGLIVGPWVALPAGAQVVDAEAMFACFHSGGDGIIDPSLRLVQMQLRS